MKHGRKIQSCVKESRVRLLKIFILKHDSFLKNVGNSARSWDMLLKVKPYGVIKLWPFNMNNTLTC